MRAVTLVLVLGLLACGTEGEGPASDTGVSTSTPGALDTSSASATSAGPSVGTLTACRGTAMSGRGIGGLRIGMTMAAVHAACRVTRDTTRLASEGQTARVISVAFPGETVEAEIVSDRVWRIEVTSPRFRTGDSLGVGTPLSRLLALDNPRGITGEGQLFVVSPAHCGLSFRLSDNGSSARSQNWDRAALSRLPSSTVVDTILIVGCDRN